MNTRTPLIASALLAASLVSGAAHATLLARDLDGNTVTAEAYYDTVLNITWLKDADYALTSGHNANDGRLAWSTANNWAANLSFTDGINVYNNWRLPTLRPINGIAFNYTVSFDGSTDGGYNITSPNSELSYMFHVNLGNFGSRTSTNTPSGCNVTGIDDTCLAHVGPFSNLQSQSYWFDTRYAPDSRYSSWNFAMHDGSQGGGYSTGAGAGFYAWAVSDGDVGIASIPEPETYAMMLAGLGLVGYSNSRYKRQ